MTAGTDLFSSLVSDLTPTTTTTNGNFVVSKALNLRSFSATLAAAPDSPTIFAVRQDGSSTALLCTITSPATTCSLTANVSVAAIDTLNVRIRKSLGSTITQNATWSLTWDVGPAGPIGLQGPSGPSGRTGASGLRGPTGAPPG